MRNKYGIFVNDDLEKKCPLLFVFIQTLLEQHNIQQAALQKMLEQKGHLDPHAHSSKPEGDRKECHIVSMTLLGHHNLGVSTSRLIHKSNEGYITWGRGNGGGGLAAVKVEPRDLNDILVIRRRGKKLLHAILPLFLGGNTDPTIVHLGIPGDINTSPGETEMGQCWVSSQELVQ